MIKSTYLQADFPLSTQAGLNLLEQVQQNRMQAEQLAEIDRQLASLLAGNQEFIFIGCDEVGRGCIAGPLVAAASCLGQVDYLEAWLQQQQPLKLAVTAQSARKKSKAGIPPKTAQNTGNTAEVAPNQALTTDSDSPISSTQETASTTLATQSRAEQYQQLGIAPQAELRELVQQLAERFPHCRVSAAEENSASTTAEPKLKLAEQAKAESTDIVNADSTTDVNPCSTSSEPANSYLAQSHGYSYREYFQLFGYSALLAEDKALESRRSDSVNPKQESQDLSDSPNPHSHPRVDFRAIAPHSLAKKLGLGLSPTLDLGFSHWLSLASAEQKAWLKRQEFISKFIAECLDSKKISEPKRYLLNHWLQELLGIDAPLYFDNYMTEANLQVEQINSLAEQLSQRAYQAQFSDFANWQLQDNQALALQIQDYLQNRTLQVNSHACFVAGIVEVPAEVLDQINNILLCSLFAMRLAIAQVIQQLYQRCQKLGINFKQEVQPRIVVLVDGHAQIPNLPYRQYAIVEGDRRIKEIAVASILAKVYRDSKVGLLGLLPEYQAYGLTKHKGYYTKDHKEALCSVGYSDQHRKSFEPITSMVQAEQNRST